MDITFYALVVLACIILMLAMWACSAGGVNKWGPDLTLELPVDVIRDALYPPNPTVHTPPDKRLMTEEVVPSAPTELLHEPLLMRAEPMGVSDPPFNIKPPVPPSVPPRSFKPPVAMRSPPPNINQAHPFLNSPTVRVLPTNFAPNQKLRPPMYSFTPEKPV